MDIRSLQIPGCFEILMQQSNDKRGRFVKSFHYDQFKRHSLETDFREQYFSESKEGVIRGLHFQTPPASHAKLIYSVQGDVLDVFLDLRKGSPTFGKHLSIDLTADKGNALYLPQGIAHGFYVKSSSALLVYNVTSVYSPDHDQGIRWNSAGIQWPTARPIVSQRDQQLPKLQEYESPFVFQSNRSRKAS